MSKTTPGREPVQIIEILQPLCSRTYGVSPCMASGAATDKCYNTRATCQDTENFALGTPLSLYFSTGKVAEQSVSDAEYIIPSLVRVSTSPTRVNLSAANPDAQGLGNRALLTLEFADHPHTDRIVDPYLSDRAFDPYTRSSFWAKWLVRNKYRSNVKIKLYEGYAGQSLSSMTVREYFLDKVRGPNSAGRVTIEAKDVLARTEDRKAKAPIESEGNLLYDIDETSAIISVQNAVVAEYPVSGVAYVRVDDEIISFTGVSEVSDYINLTGCGRGEFNTTATTHKKDARVQLCLRYDNTVSVANALEDLLTTYAGIDAGFLDVSGWNTELDNYAAAYTIDMITSKPTSVYRLVSELQEQVGFFIWWDERAQQVKLKVIRGIDSDPDVITDAANIVAGSWSVEDLPRERASQIWFYYNRRNGAVDYKDAEDFNNSYVIADLESETDELYGESSIREIYSRWIVSAAAAQQTAGRLLGRYVDVPRRATFMLDAKDRDYSIGDVVEIEHFNEVDSYGAKKRRRWTVVSWEEPEPGHRVKLVCEDTTLYGKIYKITSNSEGDYTLTDAGRYYGWITDSAGLYTNGDEGTRIS